MDNDDKHRATEHSAEHKGWAHPDSDGNCDHGVVDWQKLLEEESVNGLVIVTGPDGYTRMHSLGMNSLEMTVSMLTTAARELIFANMGTQVVDAAEEIVKGRPL